jgi:hypothetical protein
MRCILSHSSGFGVEMVSAFGLCIRIYFLKTILNSLERLESLLRHRTLMLKGKEREHIPLEGSVYHWLRCTCQLQYMYMYSIFSS